MWDMETNDYFAIGIGLLAFLLSLIATVVSTRRKAFEEERASRAQLNETISKIIAARIDHGKYSKDNPGAANDPAANMVLGLIFAQVISLTKLSVYITERIPSLVTDIEYLTIAQAFAWMGDHLKAVEYFEISIRTSRDKYYEVSNRRAYADYLFSTGALGDGREQYELALKQTPVKQDDQSKAMTGWTYRMWGVSERMSGNPTRSAEKFQLAAEVYSQIHMEFLRNNYLSDLAAMRQYPVQNITTNPGAHPPAPGGSLQSGGS